MQRMTAQAKELLLSGTRHGEAACVRMVHAVYLGCTNYVQGLLMPYTLLMHCSFRLNLLLVRFALCWPRTQLVMCDLETSYTGSPGGIKKLTL